MSNRLLDALENLLGSEHVLTDEDSCAFYEDHGIHEVFGGVVFNEEEGANIATALGSHKAVILANHGVLAC